MYSRLDELKKFKRANAYNNMHLSRVIGISMNTLKRILKGGNIYKSTESAINYFLDHPAKPLDIKRLLEIKSEKGISFSDLAAEIGISDKTLFNAVKYPKVISENTTKLIQNYLDKS